MLTYTQVPTNLFETIQLNAGVLCETFNPESGEFTHIFGATTGGCNFTDTVSYKDFGEGVDNLPANTMELKRIESREVKISGTYVSADKETVAMLIGAADVSGNKITPRDELKVSDFKTIWWVGDYGDTDGGFMAIRLDNALSTGGFSSQSTDKDKNEFAFEFTAHYSIDDTSKVPYEVFIKNAE